MKKGTLLAMIGIFALAGLLCAGAFPDIEQHPSCDYCGMQRDKFAHSRMLIEYSDGSRVPTCSLHCTAVEFANSIDKLPVAIRVGDRNDHQLLDVEAASWVLGGDKPGVMTRRAKWAFAEKEGAEQFIKQHGGQLCDFDTAMKAAYEDMYQDTKMIRKKRQAKRLKMQQQGS